MATANLTPARLRDLLECDPESGRLVWRVTTNGRVKAGKIAGYLRPDGYIGIRIDGHHYFAHRLVWLFQTGAWPANQIDHRDGDKSNNRFENLREATRSENMQNQRKAPRNNLSSGLLGVTWSKQHGKWRTQIWIDGKNRHIGRFPTAEEASAAYLEAKRRFHPFGTL